MFLAVTGIGDAASEVTSVMSSVLTFITGNPVLMVFFVAGFVGIAAGLIRKFKH